MSILKRSVIALLLTPLALGIAIPGPASAAPAHRPISLLTTQEGRTIWVTGSHFTPGAIVTLGCAKHPYLASPGRRLSPVRTGSVSVSSPVQTRPAASQTRVRAGCASRPPSINESTRPLWSSCIARELESASDTSSNKSPWKGSGAVSTAALPRSHVITHANASLSQFALFHGNPFTP